MPTCSGDGSRRRPWRGSLAPGSQRPPRSSPSLCRPAASRRPGPTWGLRRRWWWPRPISRGSTIDAGSLRVVDVPTMLVPPTPSWRSTTAGRVLVADLAEGEVVTATRLALAGTGPVAAQVPPGLRAFVLPVGPPAGTVRPGDRVDVVATYGANGGRPYTDTVATALEVIDVVDGGRRRRAGRPRHPPARRSSCCPTRSRSRASRAASLALLTIAIVGPDESTPSVTAEPFAQPPPRRYPCRPPIRPRRLGRRAGRRPAGPRPTSVRPFLADARGR